MAYAGVALQAIEHGKAIDIRQVDIQENRGRRIVARHRQGGVAAQRDDAFEALFTRIVQKNFRETEVVFHDQYRRVARRDRIAIVEMQIVLHVYGKDLPR